MSGGVSGIHHITAMAGDPQANIDFYTRVIGLRFVKRTVNFDDPGTYHFYYGDETGTPGTILTFFPWGAQALRGRIGTGQVAVTALAVPDGSLDFWTARLREHGVPLAGPSVRFDERVISFRDPDGLALEIVAAPGDRRPGRKTADIPAEHAVRGFHAPTLSLSSAERTATLLTETLGFRPVAQEGPRTRFAAGDGSAGTLIDVAVEPVRPRGTMGTGAVHHIAFRAATDDIQMALREAAGESGREVTSVIDRNYFRSIYFREPGGVLFEIATDAPGFGVDEAVAELGMHLKLPAWLEQHRSEVEERLPPIDIPAFNNPGRA